MIGSIRATPGVAAAIAPRDRPFRVLRWLAGAWVAALVPAYFTFYGPSVFLNLCDMALVLTAVGLWRASPLLLSSQALSSLVVEGAWNVDLVWRAVTGEHLIGGTAYMWDPRYPLWLRLLSAFHVWLPIVVVLGIRRVGYDRRGLPLQCVVAGAALALSRALTGPDENQNFVYRDPLLGESWGPGVLHVAVIWTALAAVYLLTHLLLSRLARRWPTVANRPPRVDRQGGVRV